MSSQGNAQKEKNKPLSRNELKEFYAKKSEAQQAAFAATPLSQVMEICGFADTAEKSDSAHTKYNVNGVLFRAPGNRFSILTGDS